jgi:hypothetical protein
MQFDNQKTRNVADVVAKILAGESAKQEPQMLGEELVGNQHKIDANKNKKIDAHDFKLLRKKKKVEEETEEIDETNHARSATKSEYQKSLKTLEKMPEFGAMSKSLKRRDQDAEYDKRKQDEFKKSLKKEETELTESHFKIGDEVICKASGMEGEVVKVDPKGEGKYYTVKREDGKMVKYAPNELKKDDEEDEDEKEDKKEMKESAGASKGKEEKFHMSLDKLVHKTFGHSPAEKKEKVKKEEAEQIDELSKSTLGSYVKKAAGSLADTNYKMGTPEFRNLKGKEMLQTARKTITRQDGIETAARKLSKEETEEIDEAKKALWPGTPEYKAKHGTDKEKHEAKYGKSDVKKLAPYGYRDKSEYEKTKDMKEEVEELDELSKDTLKSYAGKVIDKTRTMPQGAKKQKHLTGFGKAMDKMKEEKSFSAMLESYKEGGLKYIASLVKEEPDNAEYTKEVEDQKAKMDGKKKGGDVAKASVQAVKVEETEIQVINADIANGVDQIDIEERSLTEPEMKKKEEIVMSMKKKMPGFKERYGERAKSVIYGTATKLAKKD